MGKKEGVRKRSENKALTPGWYGSKKIFGVIPAFTMILLVCAVYTTPSLLTGKEFLLGTDFLQLHQHRIEYAKEALSAGGSVPGWYTREFMGTPFRSNLHSFPLIPNRLVFFLMETARAYAFSMILAASLSALFTYLFSRKLGMPPIGSACAGWTFACAGFFASRVMAGQLSLLEAYYFLPLLLWLSESTLQSTQHKRRAAITLFLLALSSASVSLAGHPQLPFYSISVVTLYTLCRGRNPHSVSVIVSIFSGVLSTSFAWFPFLDLIKRSSRILGLSPSENDIAMPFSRLKAFILPWVDGWPPNVTRAGLHPFERYPNCAYFWDTTCYMGILPVVAVVILATLAVSKKIKFSQAGAFFAVAGPLSVLLSLVPTQSVFGLTSPTLFRSPSRLLYITSFCFALGFGHAVHLAWQASGKRETRLKSLVLAALLVIHIADLGIFDKHFIKPIPYSGGIELVQAEDYIRANLGDGRVAVDFDAPLKFNRRFDDAGYFDAIALAGTYKGVLEAAGLDPKLNTEVIDGPQLPTEALRSFGVRFVVTRFIVKGLRELAKLSTPEGSYGIFEVPEASPRAVLLRDDGNKKDIDSGLLTYERPSPDEIILRSECPLGGFIKIVESWDPGWKAEVDGEESEILKFETFMMGVRVPPGKHETRLIFTTPEVFNGLIFSAAGPLLFLLAIFLVFGWSRLWKLKAIRSAIDDS